MTAPAPTLPPLPTTPADQDVYAGSRVEMHPIPEDGPPLEVTYEPPLEESVAVGGLWISVRHCATCGVRFPVAVGGYIRLGGEVLPQPDRRTCDRCTFATAWPTAPADVVAVMQELRWRFDEYRYSIVKGEREAVTQERFNRCVNLFFSLGPRLLDECERIYGDQVVAGIQAVATGG